MIKNTSKNQFELDYVELDLVKRKNIAARLHSHFGQPLVASKSFANAIISLQGQNDKLPEAKEMANIILQMTDEVYSLAYDLMLESDVDIVDEIFNLESAIKYFADKIRLSKRGIKFELDIHSLLSELLDKSKLFDEGLQRVLFDNLRSLMVYIARYAETNILRINIKEIGNTILTELFIKTEITLDKLNQELVITGVKNHIEVVNGRFSISKVKDRTRFCIELPISKITQATEDKK